MNNTKQAKPIKAFGQARGPKTDRLAATLATQFELLRPKSDGARIMRLRAESSITVARYGLEDNPASPKLALLRPAHNAAFLNSAPQQSDGHKADVAQKNGDHKSGG